MRGWSGRRKAQGEPPMKLMKQSRQIMTIILAMAWALQAQDTGAAAIQKKLLSEYKLTKITDDKSDIVTAGDVIVLHKDKIAMVAASSSVPCMNTYQNGKISNGSCGGMNKVKKLGGFTSLIGKSIPGADKAPATRNFVSDEKFWVTKIEVKETGHGPGAVFDFFTDATPSGDNGIRYMGKLTIQFGSKMPTPDEALKTVAEVITVAPQEESKDDKQPAQQQGGGQQAAAPPAEQAPAAQEPPPPQPVPAPAATLEAPPPPPPDPVSVTAGQTIKQVEDALGQPVKKLKVGAKTIYVYKDLKVTFTNGKVTNVE